MFDKIIIVTADKNTRLARVILGNQAKSEDVLVVMNSQLSDEGLKGKKHDFIICNNGQEDITSQVAHIHNELKQSSEQEDIISQEEFNSMMDEVSKAKEAHAKEMARINNRILKAILKVKGKKFHDDLISIALPEIEYCDSFSIIKKPTGERQSESWGAIKESWVWQHSSGDSGDSFYGEVCIKLKNNKYLSVPFSC